MKLLHSHRTRWFAALSVKLSVETFEDRCNPDGAFGPWGTPVNLGSVVNTNVSDQHPAITKDGLSLYITTSRPEFVGDTVLDDNIWVSQRASEGDPWGAPVELGPAVNTPSNDRVPTFSRDGHWMFFGSNRPGVGGLDLWASYRQDVHDDLAWQPAVNLGSGVNSAADDDGPTLFADDGTGVTTLYFTSARPQPDGTTDFDIYSSTQSPDGTFTAPVPVPELNSAGRDTRTAIRHDGREIFITSDRTDLPGIRGLIDLWVSMRATTSDPWSTPVNLGPTINTPANDGAPAISSHSTALYFYSNRAGGVGGNDLYVTTRVKKNCPSAASLAPFAAAASAAPFVPTGSATPPVRYDEVDNPVVEFVPVNLEPADSAHELAGAVINPPDKADPPSLFGTGLDLG